MEEIINTIAIDSELQAIQLYMHDADIDEAMDSIIKLIANPKVPASTAAPLVVKLQALSSKFALQAKYYMIYDSDETKEVKTRKKNTLMTLAAELEKLAGAVKYLVKV